VAQIVPPYLPVPPTGYGGIEAVAALLCDGLVARGHEVTLFASPLSHTRARLAPTFDEPPAPEAMGSAFIDVVHIMRAYRRHAEFDIIHDHMALGAALGSFTGARIAHTLHGAADPDSVMVYRAIAGLVGFVAISDAQRAAFEPHVPILATVSNAVNLDTYPFRESKEGFLLFLGRFSPEKGPHLAIDVARKAGRQLFLAGKLVTADERAYFAEQVEPRLGPDARYLGEVDAQKKIELLCGASALLFPIQWEEPFGLVMIEAAACGTPVLAFPRGAAKEVVVDGKTGFLVRDVGEMAEAVRDLGSIAPAVCRRHAEERYSPEAMVAGYEAAYLDLIER